MASDGFIGALNVPQLLCGIRNPRLCLAQRELAGLHFNFPRRPERQTVHQGNAHLTVFDVLEYLASGMNEQAILADFPVLRREHIQAVLGFAAERERRLSAPPAVSCGLERCLNHAQPGIIATYITHQYLVDKHDAITKWTDHLQAFRDGE